MAALQKGAADDGRQEMKRHACIMITSMRRDPSQSCVAIARQHDGALGTKVTYIGLAARQAQTCCNRTRNLAASSPAAHPRDGAGKDSEAIRASQGFDVLRVAGHDCVHGTARARARSSPRCAPAVLPLLGGQTPQRRQRAGIGQPRRKARRYEAQVLEPCEDAAHTPRRVVVTRPRVTRPRVVCAGRATDLNVLWPSWWKRR